MLLVSGPALERSSCTNFDLTMADYSGELSHWNFSKRVQHEIESFGPPSVRF